MKSEDLYCNDCYYMYWHDDTTLNDMDCCHGNAIPENGAPELIVGEPHNCPFFETRTKEQKIYDYIIDILYNLRYEQSEEAMKQNNAFFWKVLGGIEILAKLKDDLIKEDLI